jgi:competence protein ComEA
MNAEELFFKYSPLVRKNLLILALGILGMIFFIYGLIGLILSGNAAQEEIIFESSAQQNSDNKTIFVDVQGAVIHPGMYELASDSRLQDVLSKTGGLSANADREYVARSMNLAERLEDGRKIYVPSIGESTTGETGTTGITGSQVNINSASQTTLETLKGVGPVTAQKIIDNRPYGSIEELLDKKIVGSKVFENIRDEVTIY